MRAGVWLGALWFIHNIFFQKLLYAECWHFSRCLQKSKIYNILYNMNIVSPEIRCHTMRHVWQILHLSALYGGGEKYYHSFLNAVVCGCQGRPGDKGDQLRCIGTTSHSYPGMNNESLSLLHKISFILREHKDIIQYFVRRGDRLIERAESDIDTDSVFWWLVAIDGIKRLSSILKRPATKNFNCKNRNGFSTWYIFCFCPLLDVRVTGDQQWPGPGLDDKCCE